MAPEMLLMTKVVFDKLPKADQDMIRAAAKESVAFQRQKWDEQEAKSLAVVTKARRRRCRRRRQGLVPGGDGPGVRQVHDHARPEAPGQGGPGHQVNSPLAGAHAARAQRRARLYTRLCAALSKASLMLAVVGLIAVILCVQCQVVGRYVFNDTPDLGRGAGAAAGAVRHRAGRGGGRARRRPHRPGIAGGAAARGLAAARRAADPRAGGAVRRASWSSSGWHVDHA